MRGQGNRLRLDKQKLGSRIRDTEKHYQRIRADDENYIDEACWVGWKQRHEEEGNRMVPNCVKEDDMDEDIKKMDMGDVIKDFYKSDAPNLRVSQEETQGDAIAQNFRVKKKNFFHRRDLRKWFGKGER